MIFDYVTSLPYRLEVKFATILKPTHPINDYQEYNYYEVVIRFIDRYEFRYDIFRIRKSCLFTNGRDIENFLFQAEKEFKKCLDNSLYEGEPLREALLNETFKGWNNDTRK